MALTYGDYEVHIIKKGNVEYNIKDAVAASAIDILMGNQGTQGAIATDIYNAKEELIGAQEDTASADTIKGAKAYAASLATNYDANGAAAGVQTSLIGTTSDESTANTINGAKKYAAGLVAALDSTQSQTAGADGLALSITETDGVITGISGSIAANTYDAHGAATSAKSEVIGNSNDDSTAITIYGARAYTDAAATNVQTNAINTSNSYADGLIAALDSTQSQTAGTDGLALSITETNGVITAISGSIAANTYDAHGAASAVQTSLIGTSEDLSSANTINGVKKYAAEAAAGAQSAAIAKVNELAGTDWAASAGTVKDIIDELKGSGSAVANLDTVVDKLRGDFTYGEAGSQGTDVKGYIDNKFTSGSTSISNGVLTLAI